MRYVGITGRDASVRFSEHLGSNTGKSLLRYEVITSELTKIQARVLEQTLINQFKLQSNGGLLFNNINSISPKYWSVHSIKK